MLTSFFTTILNMSLTASIIILCVLLFRVLLRRAPKIFSYALWAVVLFRLLCPVSFSSEISVFRIFQTQMSNWGSIEYITIPEANTGLPNQTVSPQADQSMVGGMNTDYLLPDGNNNRINTTSQSKSGHIFTSEPAMNVAAALWLTGVIGMLLYAVISYFKLRKQLLGAVLLQENIYMADYITSPFVTGFFRPRIYLPSVLSSEEQIYIIKHEKHHIRRRDYLIRILAYGTLCIHWFNPLVWISFLKSGNDMEMSCDEAVIKKLDASVKKEYSRSLLLLATGQRFITATSLAFGEGNTKNRIKNVMNYKKPAFWGIVAGILICLAAAVCLVSNPTIFRTLESPFGNSYQVKQIVCEAPIFNFSYTLQTAPSYQLTSDFKLLVDGEMVEGETFSEVKLKKENFDVYFKEYDGISGWIKPDTSGTVTLTVLGAEELRKENYKAWKLQIVQEERSVFYYLLQQKNGDLYIAYGYEPDPLIRWLFLLQDSTVNVVDDINKAQDSGYEPADMKPADGGTEELKQTPMDASGETDYFILNESRQVISTYGFLGDESMEQAFLTLYDNNSFEFSFSPISSYIGFGTYTIEDERLTLITIDLQYTYVFDMDEDTLIFDAGASSDMVWYSGLKDGSVMK